MKNAILASAAIVIGSLLWFARGALPGRAGAQPQADAPVLSPKLLAYSKPIEAAADDSELTKKLKERHNSAVALLDERVKEYKKGTREISLVYEAARLAADAKLDLAADDSAKVEVLEQTLELAKLAEAHLQQQLAKGFGSKADLERARYARLTLEVDLLRAKQKAGKPKSD
jgi:hypothetical protein